MSPVPAPAGSRVLVLPTPRALLAPYPLQDPVPDLRRACLEALTGICQPRTARIVVVATALDAGDRDRGVTVPLGFRVARHLLDALPEGSAPRDRAWEEVEAGESTTQRLRADPPEVLIVMADGSACRTEQAPGHLHPDAAAFDAAIEGALRDGDPDTLGHLDDAFAREVWCHGAPGLRLLGRIARGREIQASLRYAEAPYGVAWWVCRWEIETGRPRS